MTAVSTMLGHLTALEALHKRFEDAGELDHPAIPGLEARIQEAKDGLLVLQSQTQSRGGTDAPDGPPADDR